MIGQNIKSEFCRRMCVFFLHKVKSLSPRSILYNSISTMVHIPSQHTQASHQAQKEGKTKDARNRNTGIIPSLLFMKTIYFDSKQGGRLFSL